MKFFIVIYKKDKHRWLKGYCEKFNNVIIFFYNPETSQMKTPKVFISTDAQKKFDEVPPPKEFKLEQLEEIPQGILQIFHDLVHFNYPPSGDFATVTLENRGNVDVKIIRS